MAATNEDPAKDFEILTAENAEEEPVLVELEQETFDPELYVKRGIGAEAEH